MKNLDLNAYGVEEMDQQILITTNGGLLTELTWLVIGILVAEILDRGASQDFEDGRQAAHDFWN